MSEENDSRDILGSFIDEASAWASGLSLESVPPSVIDHAKILLADTIAAAFSHP